MREVMPGVLTGIPETLLNISNMPLANFQTHRLWTWQHKDDNAWWQIIADYGNGEFEHPFLTLIGKPGTGKTHLAQSIAWQWLERGRTVFYNHVVELLDKMRDSYRFDDYKPILTDFAKNAALLILDDLGSEKLTEWAGQELDFIVDHRYEHQKPLIVTSNLAITQLPDRIADRLAEGMVIMLKGESFRRKKGGLK